MENIFKMNLTMWGLQYAMTDMTNVHTCTICSVHLFIVGVLVADRQLLKFSGDVVYSPGVHVPVAVHTIGGRGCCHHRLLGSGTIVVGVVAVPAAIGRMAFKAAYLTDDARFEVAAASSIAVATASHGVTSLSTTASATMGV